jgi:uncharacterized protein YcbK (DUF882 family)
LNNVSHIIWPKGEDMGLHMALFKQSDFECNCSLSTCKRQLMSIDLMSSLQHLRVDFGHPIWVTSAFRCKEYNRIIGSKDTSQHIRGNAVDITCHPQFLDQLYELCCKYFKAVGDGRKYNDGKRSGFIHVDIRKDKIRRWNY